MVLNPILVELKYPLLVSIIFLELISGQSLIRGAVILLMESRKSSKKVPENRKKGENFAGNRKMPFWSHGKLKKKSLWKTGKLIFLWGETANFDRSSIPVGLLVPEICPESGGNKKIQ